MIKYSVWVAQGVGQAGGMPRISLGRKGQGYIHNPVFFLSSQSPMCVCKVE